MHLQAVVVTDPYMIQDVLGRTNEVDKSVETVYSKFNVVRVTLRPGHSGRQVDKVICMHGSGGHQ